jgi:AraC family transcriptional regulator
LNQNVIVVSVSASNALLSGMQKVSQRRPSANFVSAAASQLSLRRANEIYLKRSTRRNRYADVHAFTNASKNISPDNQPERISCDDFYASKRSTSMASAISVVNGVFGRACLLDKDRRVGAHAHAEPHVILKIDGEDFDYEVGDTVAPCTREHVVLVNALEMHLNSSIGKERSLILALYLSPQWLVQQHASLLVGGKLFASPSAPVTAVLRDRADRLAAEMLPCHQVKEARLQFLASEVAFSIFEQCTKLPGHVERTGRFNDFRIRRAVSFMRENVGEALDMANVAQRMGLSRSRFFDLFMECTGLSPKHYLDMLRMETAIGELTSSGHTIAEIAEACGYSAQSHFTRFFVERIGVTPSDYRRAAGSHER